MFLAANDILFMIRPRKREGCVLQCLIQIMSLRPVFGRLRIRGEISLAPSPSIISMLTRLSLQHLRLYGMHCSSALID